MEYAYKNDKENTEMKFQEVLLYNIRTTLGAKEKTFIDLRASRYERTHPVLCNPRIFN